MKYSEYFDPNNKYWKDYEYEIKLDRTVEWKTRAPRRMPLEMKYEFKIELDKMVARGILTKVNTPTKCVSSVLPREATWRP